MLNTKSFISAYQAHKFSCIFYLCIITIFECNFLLFTYLTGYLLPISKWTLSTAPLYTLASAVFLSIPCFLTSKRIIMLFGGLLAWNIFMVANMCYYRVYANIIPLSSFAQITHIRDMKDDIISLLEKIDLLFVMPTVILGFVYYFYLRKQQISPPFKFRKQFLFIIILPFLLLISADLLRYRLIYKRIGAAFDGIKYEPMMGLKKYGFIIFYAHQAYTLSTKTKISSEERAEINQWLDKHQSYIQSEPMIPYDSIKTNKPNILIIIVESLESWVINTKINDKEITPTINSLLATYSHLYAPYVVPQTKSGRSSDAQLMIHTGLLPIFNNSVFMQYSDNQYFSIPKALQERKYYSCTMMGNQASFWNQLAMNKAMYFDKLISIQDYEVDDYIGFGLSDESFFRQSVEKVTNIKKPFFIQMITLTSHSPFNHIAQEKLQIQLPQNYNKELVNYLSSIHYVDYHLGKFVEQLKKTGLLDSTLLMITGDHEAFINRKKRIELSQDKNFKHLISSQGFVPFILINTPTTVDYKKFMGQIDIYPTLLDVLDIRHYEWKGLGYSIFSKGKKEIAINAIKEIVGDTIGINNEERLHYIQAWKVSDLIIKSDFFRKENLDK
jgi:phosphoglycerol transferase MdoB-like AlkP superfamily enzyme